MLHYRVLCDLTAAILSSDFVNGHISIIQTSFLDEHETSFYCLVKRLCELQVFREVCIFSESIRVCACSALIKLVFSAAKVMQTVVSTSAVDCLERLISEMTYYGLSGTLNPTHSLALPNITKIGCYALKL